MGDAFTFGLEIPTTKLNPGQTINLLATVDHIGKYSACTTEVFKHSFLTDVAIPQGTTKIAILQGLVEFQGVATVCVMKGPNTQVMFPREWQDHHLLQIRETCTGIGALTSCSRVLSMQITTQNDCNPAFTQWLRTHGSSYVIDGDITVPATWKAMHDASDEPAKGARLFPYRSITQKTSSQQ